MKEQYYLELVWNREFDFVRHGSAHDSVDAAVIAARRLENMGDGAAVKKTRIVNSEGDVVWAYGEMVR